MLHTTVMAVEGEVEGGGVIWWRKRERERGGL